MGVNSVSTPVSASQLSPDTMRYAPSSRPSAFTGLRELLPMNTFAALPDGTVTIGRRAPLIFWICR